MRVVCFFLLFLMLEKDRARINLVTDCKRFSSSSLKDGDHSIEGDSGTQSGRPWDRQAAGASWPQPLLLRRPSCNPCHHRLDCKRH